MDNYIEIIGFIAAFLTTTAFLPQVYQTWKTKDVTGLSLPMLVLFSIGVACWLIYGILLKSPSLMFANAITTLSSFILVYYKIKYHKK